MHCAVSLRPSPAAAPPAQVPSSAAPAASPPGFRATADVVSFPLASHDPSRSAGPCPFPLRVVTLATRRENDANLLAPSPMIALQADLALTPQSIRALVMLGPDVAVVDLRGTPNALVAAQLRRIHGASPRTRIVAIAADEAMARQALLGGATACIGPGDEPLDVLRAVHDAARNRMHLGGVARQVLRRSAAAMTA